MTNVGLLMWWLEHNKLLDNTQNGFSKGRLCSDNLTRLSIDIKRGFLEDKSTVAVFLDITSAYDNVIRKVLIEKLDRLECPAKITKYIDIWMKNRITKVIINKEEEERMINKGLSQGAVSVIICGIYKAIRKRFRRSQDTTIRG